MDAKSPKHESVKMLIGRSVCQEAFSRGGALEKHRLLCHIALFQSLTLSEGRRDGSLAVSPIFSHTPSKGHWTNEGGVSSDFNALSWFFVHFF